MNYEISNSPKDVLAREFVSQYYQATVFHWDNPGIRSAFEGVVHAVWMNGRYQSPFFNKDEMVPIEKELFRLGAALGFSVGCLDNHLQRGLSRPDGPGVDVPVSAEMAGRAKLWISDGPVNFRNVADALEPADTLGLLVVNFSHGYVGGADFVARNLELKS